MLQMMREDIAHLQHSVARISRTIGINRTENDDYVAVHTDEAENVTYEMVLSAQQNKRERDKRYGEILDMLGGRNVMVSYAQCLASLFVVAFTSQFPKYKSLATREMYRILGSTGTDSDSVLQALQTDGASAFGAMISALSTTEEWRVSGIGRLTSILQRATITQAIGYGVHVHSACISWLRVFKSPK